MLRKCALSIAALCATALLSFAGPAGAREGFVSANGTNNSACSQAQPCLTFQWAYNQGVGAVRDVVGIGSGVISDIVKLSDYAARSIG